MTNTVSTIYNGLTGNLVDTVDGLVGLSVLILGVLVVLAVVSRWVPKKKKVL